MDRKVVIFSVDADKADGLVSALEKRDYITVVSMDRESRKRFRDCPCCKRRLAKEVLFTINDKLLHEMLRLLRGMTIAKTVILVNKDNPISDIPHVERERCVEFDPKMLWRAEILGLVKPFIDGTRKTYFTDAMEFLINEEAHSPSYMVTIDGEVVETGGSAFLDEVKFKDEQSKTTLKRELRVAVGAIPESTITFVTKGQMSLV